MCGVQPVIEAAKVELAVSAPLRSSQAEVPRTSWVSAPLRSVQAEVPRTSWTLCARTMCSSQLEDVSLDIS